MSTSLQASVRNCFGSATRSRGDAYYASGRVAPLRNAGPDRVGAVVRGSRAYQVDLRRSGTTIQASCTCPFLQRELEPCKHVWAALRTALEAGHLAGADGEPPTYVSVDTDELLDHFLDEGDEGEEDASASPSPRESDRVGLRSRSLGGGRIRGRRKPSPRPKPVNWKEAISSVQGAQESVPSGIEPVDDPDARRIIYVIDVEESARSEALCVSVETQERKVNGDWGKPKTVRHLSSESKLANPDDRGIASLLFGDSFAAPRWTSYGYSDFGNGDRFRYLSTWVAETALPLLCRTGRCFLKEEREAAIGPEPLRWDAEGDPWRFGLELVPTEGKQGYDLRGILRRDGEALPLSDPQLVFAGGAILFGDRAAPLDVRGGSAWIALLGKAGAVHVPGREVDRFLARFYDTHPRPPLTLPDEFELETVRSAPRFHLEVATGGRGRRHKTSRLPCRLLFRYGDLTIPWAGAHGDPVDLASRRVFLRDPDAERGAARRLHELGLLRRRDRWDGQGSFEIPSRSLPEVVRTLIEEGWTVEAEGKLVRGSGRFNVQIVSGVDWFDLQGGATFGGGTARLPELLRALKHGEQWVKLDDGSFGILAEEWLQGFGDLARLGEADGDALRFRRSQIGLLDVLLAQEPNVDVDAGFRRAREELRSFEGITPEDPPPSFRGTLRDYQREGLGWFRFLDRFGFGGCLADDMGLGKTVQVLALFASFPRTTGKRKPSLVVAPRSLVFNWLEEAARFTPRLRWRDHTGIGRRRDARAFSRCDVVITTYGTLRRDIALFRETEFECIVLDEAQAIKNARTQASRAVRLLRGRRRLALSGTPIENHLGELWSLFEFLNPGVLGRAAAFRSIAKQAAEMDSRSRDLLARAARPFILRRTKAQVARELPARTEQTLYCEMNKEQRRLYDELLAHYRSALMSRVEEKGIERSRIQVLEALLRLRQAACHPGLIDRGRREEPSAKLDALFPQLEEILTEDHKALVFSQFTSFLSIVRDRLDAAGTPYAYLDGRTRKRAEVVRRFQEDPDCPLFLISLKAGGLGLNLTAAEYVYLLDPWWNPAVEAQAIDRTHRIGQTRPVFAYRMVVRNTVEERILELQSAKKELADSIIRADDRTGFRLTREDLELLLS